MSKLSQTTENGTGSTTASQQLNHSECNNTGNFTEVFLCKRLITRWAICSKDYNDMNTNL